MMVISATFTSLRNFSRPAPIDAPWQAQRFRVAVDYSSSQELIYVYGGRDHLTIPAGRRPAPPPPTEDIHVIYNDIWTFDTNTYDWTLLLAPPDGSLKRDAPNARPKARDSDIFVFDSENTLLFLGGSEYYADQTVDVWRMDISGHSYEWICVGARMWSDEPDFDTLHLVDNGTYWPGFRHSPSVFRWDSSSFALWGGYESSMGFEQYDLWLFSVTTLSWTKLSTDFSTHFLNDVVRTDSLFWSLDSRVCQYGGSRPPPVGGGLWTYWPTTIVCLDKTSLLWTRLYERPDAEEPVGTETYFRYAASYDASLPLPPSGRFFVPLYFDDLSKVGFYGGIGYGPYEVATPHSLHSLWWFDLDIENGNWSVLFPYTDHFDVDPEWDNGSPGTIFKASSVRVRVDNDGLIQNFLFGSQSHRYFAGIEYSEEPSNVESVGLLGVVKFGQSCYGIDSQKSEIVCGGNGECVMQDECVCEAKGESKGLECREIIASMGSFYSSDKTIEIAYKVPKTTLLEKFDTCNDVVVTSSLHSLGANPSCSFVESSTDSAIAETLRIHLGEHAYIQGGDSLSVRVLTTSEIVVVSVVEAEEGLNDVEVITIGASVGSVALLGVICIITLSLCLVGWKARSLKRRQSKFAEIEDEIDLLVQERRVEKATGLGHLKINKKLFQLDFADVELVEEVGRGGGGAVVYKAKLQGKTVAFKIFRISHVCSSEEGMEDFEKEISFVSSLHHTNIVNFLGFCLKPPRLGIVMEFASEGDVRYYLKRVNLSEKPPLSLASLSDEERSLMTRRAGTSTHMAPEVASGSNYGLSTDVFSFAIVMFEVLVNVDVYDPETLVQGAVELRVASDPAFRPILPSDQSHLHPELIALMKECWAHDPETRPTMRAVRERIEAVDLSADEPRQQIVIVMEEKQAKSSEMATTVTEDEYLGEFGVRGPNHEIEVLKVQMQALAARVRDVEAEKAELLQAMQTKDQTIVQLQYSLSMYAGMGQSIGNVYQYGNQE